MAATRPRQIFDQVKPRMEALGIQGLSIAFGPDELARTSSAPRIVWCKSTGAILPTDRAGGNPRPLVRRRVRVLAHLWGKDDDQAEQLLEETVREVQALTAGVYRPVEEAWPLHDKPANNKAGAYCILTFEVDLYVESKPTQKAKVTNVQLDTDGAVQGDGILQAGET